MYCQYYQAQTCKPKTWFVVGCFRNEDNLIFERTLDTKKSILEFFVPNESEEKFLKIMSYLKKNGYILKLQKLENRLKNSC
ncbi:hypothetical protein KAT08_00145 [Candidatus Babeliales bacterium]|nr:hypothetical protein [Candidatus Babeliales bacterium]